jgi:hypothetical protein
MINRKGQLIVYLGEVFDDNPDSERDIRFSS